MILTGSFCLAQWARWRLIAVFRISGVNFQWAFERFFTQRWKREHSKQAKAEQTQYRAYGKYHRYPTGGFHENAF